VAGWLASYPAIVVSTSRRANKGKRESNSRTDPDIYWDRRRRNVRLTMFTEFDPLHDDARKASCDTLRIAEWHEEPADVDAYE
jgi:hypothetical protein